MCYFNVILLSNVISSIGPKISDADTYFHVYAKEVWTKYRKEYYLYCQQKTHVLPSTNLFWCSNVFAIGDIE